MPRGVCGRSFLTAAGELHNCKPASRPVCFYLRVMELRASPWTKLDVITPSTWRNAYSLESNAAHCSQQRLSSLEKSVQCACKPWGVHNSLYAAQSKVQDLMTMPCCMWLCVTKVKGKISFTCSSPTLSKWALEVSDDRTRLSSFQLEPHDSLLNATLHIKAIGGLLNKVNLSFFIYLRRQLSYIQHDSCIRSY